MEPRLCFWESNFQLSVQSNPGLLWFCFTSFCDWSKNSHHSLNQSDLKLKPSATWSIALQAVCLFNLEFSLASCDIFPALIGCCYFDLVFVPRHSIRKHSNIERYGNLCVESGPGLIALVSLYFLLNLVLKKKNTAILSNYNLLQLGHLHLLAPQEDCLFLIIFSSHLLFLILFFFLFDH